MIPNDQPRDENGRFAPRDHAVYEVRADGYCRWRAYDSDLGRDVYVYVHQLLACVDHDPREVFDPANSVHHEDEVRWHNTSENLEVHEHGDHWNWHANGVPLPDGGRA